MSVASIEPPPDGNRMIPRYRNGQHAWISKLRRGSARGDKGTAMGSPRTRSRCVRGGLVFLFALCTRLAFSQATPPARELAVGAPTIAFGSVAEALSALTRLDGNGTVVTHADGWVIINEPLAAAQWSFTPATHAAHPAVVRRAVHRGADGKVSVETASLCEAAAAACTDLLHEFATLNDRITQSVRARGRQGSSQP